MGETMRLRGSLPLRRYNGAWSPLGGGLDDVELGVGGPLSDRGGVDAFELLDVVSVSKNPLGRSGKHAGRGVYHVELSSVVSWCKREQGRSEVAQFYVQSSL